MGGSKKQTVGYKYFAGVHMILCHGPIDALLKISVDDKTVWEGETGSARITIDKPELFGGESREGGISGELDFEMGGPTQGVNDYLSSILGGLVPAYRGVVGVVLRKMYLSMNPYLKTWKFKVKRTLVTTDGLPQWNLTKAEIVATNPDGTTIALSNPAHIIRECLTNADWGLGASEDDIDEPSFYDAADRFYSEGLGLAPIWDTQTEILEFLKIIQQHIDASLYADRRTGRFKLRAIRKDYDEETLVVLDPSNVEKLENPKKLTFGDLVNSVTVNFWDNTTGKTGSVTVSDPALEIQQGKEINTTVTYEACADATTAEKLAQRDLRSLSYPAFSCTIYTGSVAKNFNIGTVFKLNWPDYPGVDNLIMRVTGIAFGDGKSRRVKITCSEDIYDLPDGRHVQNPATGWENPRKPPNPARYSMAFEAPYYELVLSSGQSVVDAALSSNPYTGYVAAAMSKPIGGAINGRLVTNDGSGWEDVGELDFSQGATLSADISRTETAITLTEIVGASNISVGSWLQIDAEVMSVVSFASPVVTVKRGALDTIPTNHASGAVVMFWGDDAALDPTEYVASDVVSVKTRPANGSGVVALADAETHVVNIVGRAARPFPPANVQIGGEYWPSDALEEIALTWVHRNRILQTGGSPVGWFDGGVTIEPGVSYEIEVFDGALSIFSASVSGSLNSYTIPASVVETWPTYVRLVMRSERNGLLSFQEYSANLVVLGEGTPLLTAEFGTATEDELTADFNDGEHQLYGEFE